MLARSLRPDFEELLPVGESSEEDEDEEEDEDDEG
jgi:hypothetical protein